MTRVLITALLAFLTTSAWHAAAMKFPYVLNVLFLPPIILVFASQYFKPLEILMVSVICGIFVDVLGGFPVGFNVLIMLIVAISISIMNVFSGRIYNRELIYYVIAVSFVYRVLLLISQFIFAGQKTNMHLAQFLFGPVVDGVVSIPFYFLLVAVLTLFKKFDRSEFYKVRIGYGR